MLREQNNKRNTKLADLYVGNRCKDFWREVKRVNSNYTAPGSVIDGHTTPESIANAFKDQYAAILRSDFVNLDQVNSFYHSLNNDCANKDYQIFHINEVFTACHQLKKDKKDADEQLMSDAFINASLPFYKCLCTLINIAIIHGYIPADLQAGTIIPLLKSGNPDKSLLSSYRPITLSSLFGKVIDLMILNRHQKAFNSSDLQFGFKSSHSTNHCTFVAKEVIAYYINNGSDVFSCAIDMQKAFDRVDLTKLFKKLLQRSIPVLIVRILFQYFNVNLRVLWNGAHSANFCSINGVKQGGILSPYLFSIFINDLLVALELNNEGCRVGHEFFGCIAFADDILLLAPSITALRRMLDICTAYANSNNILFNPNKSHCLHFGKSANLIKQFPVELQGMMLTWTDHIVHLGHILYPNLDDSCDIDARRHDFCSQVNYFIARFGHLTPALKIRLFQTYCQSFYGSQIWDLNNNKINTFNVSWRKAVRRLWFVPYRTHRFLLPDLMLAWQRLS